MAVPQAGQNDPVWGRRSPHCEQNRRLEEPSAGTLDEVIASTSSYGQSVAADYRRHSHRLSTARQ